MDAETAFGALQQAWDAGSAFAAAWVSDLSGSIASHPLLSIAAALIFGLGFLLSRSLLAAVATSFIAIAAIVGADPVTDPLKQRVFSIGCLIAIGLMSLALALSRRRHKRLAGENAKLAHDMAEIQRLYEREVTWRRAAGDPAPRPAETAGAN